MFTNTSSHHGKRKKTRTCLCQNTQCRQLTLEYQWKRDKRGGFVQLPPTSLDRKTNKLPFAKQVRRAYLSALECSNAPVLPQKQYIALHHFSPILVQKAQIIKEDVFHVARSISRDSAVEYRIPLTHPADDEARRYICVPTRSSLADESKRLIIPHQTKSHMDAYIDTHIDTHMDAKLPVDTHTDAAAGVPEEESIQPSHSILQRTHALRRQQEWIDMVLQVTKQDQAQNKVLKQPDMVPETVTDIPGQARSIRRSRSTQGLESGDKDAILMARNIVQKRQGNTQREHLSAPVERPGLTKEASLALVDVVMERQRERHGHWSGTSTTGSSSISLHALDGANSSTSIPLPGLEGANSSASLPSPSWQHSLMSNNTNSIDSLDPALHLPLPQYQSSLSMEQSIDVIAEHSDTHVEQREGASSGSLSITQVAQNATESSTLSNSKGESSIGTKALDPSIHIGGDDTSSPSVRVHTGPSNRVPTHNSATSGDVSSTSFSIGMAESRQSSYRSIQSEGSTHSFFVDMVPPVTQNSRIRELLETSHSSASLHTSGQIGHVFYRDDPGIRREDSLRSDTSLSIGAFGTPARVRNNARGSNRLSRSFSNQGRGNIVKDDSSRSGVSISVVGPSSPKQSKRGSNRSSRSIPAMNRFHSTPKEDSVRSETSISLGTPTSPKRGPNLDHRCLSGRQTGVSRKASARSMKSTTLDAVTLPDPSINLQTNAIVDNSSRNPLERSKMSYPGEDISGHSDNSELTFDYGSPRRKGIPADEVFSDSEQDTDGYLNIDVAPKYCDPHDSLSTIHSVGMASSSHHSPQNPLALISQPQNTLPKMDDTEEQDELSNYFNKGRSSQHNSIGELHAEVPSGECSYSGLQLDKGTENKTCKHGSLSILYGEGHQSFHVDVEVIDDSSTDELDEEEEDDDEKYTSSDDSESSIMRGSGFTLDISLSGRMEDPIADNDDDSSASSGESNAISVISAVSTSQIIIERDVRKPQQKKLYIFAAHEARRRSWTLTELSAMEIEWQGYREEIMRSKNNIDISVMAVRNSCESIHSYVKALGLIRRDRYLSDTGKVLVNENSQDRFGNKRERMESETQPYLMSDTWDFLDSIIQSIGQMSIVGNEHIVALKNSADEIAWVGSSAEESSLILLRKGDSVCRALLKSELAVQTAWNEFMKVADTEARRPIGDERDVWAAESAYRHAILIQLSRWNQLNNDLRRLYQESIETQIESFESLRQALLVFLDDRKVILTSLQLPVEQCSQKLGEYQEVSYEEIEKNVHGTMLNLVRARTKLRLERQIPLHDIYLGRVSMRKSVLARKVEEVDIISTGALWKKMLAVRTVNHVYHLFAADAQLKSWRNLELPMFSFALSETTIQIIGSKIFIWSPSLGQDKKLCLRKTKLLDTKRWFQEAASVATVLDSSGAVIQK